MNKEELRKEFETWYFKDFDRQDFDSDEELQEAKDSNADFIDELVEWFWKHLEQREANFKASLREEIAKEIDAMPDFQSRDRGDDAYISGLEKALKLLDTVKPKE